MNLGTFRNLPGRFPPRAPDVPVPQTHIPSGTNPRPSEQDATFASDAGGGVLSHRPVFKKRDWRPRPLGGAAPSVPPRPSCPVQSRRTKPHVTQSRTRYTGPTFATLSLLHPRRRHCLGSALVTADMPAAAPSALCSRPAPDKAPCLTPRHHAPRLDRLARRTHVSASYASTTQSRTLTSTRGSTVTR